MSREDKEQKIHKRHIEHMRHNDIMRKKQERVPVIERLTEHAQRDVYPYHMPGHKGGRGIDPLFAKTAGKDLLRIDLTEIEGLDDLNRPEGIIREAEELAAEAFGADRTFFLVNGSTVGIEAAIIALCKPGEKILVERGFHRSVYGGLVLSGALPVYVYPEAIDDLGLASRLEIARIEELLASDKDIKAVCITSPSYYGICRPLKEIADICHKYNVPLLVDEAHGAHLPFHEELPLSAIEAGADIAVQSTHKLLTSLTGSSMMHIREGLVSMERIAESIRLLQTSSPSYPMIASLDGARRFAFLNARERLEVILKGLKEFRAKIGEMSKRIPIMELQGSLSAMMARGSHSAMMAGGEAGTIPFDPLKVYISALDMGITGEELAALLRREGAEVEFADLAGVLLYITIADDADSINRIYEILGSVLLKPESVSGKHGGVSAGLVGPIDSGNRGETRVRSARVRSILKACSMKKISVGNYDKQEALSPRDVFFADKEKIPLSKAAGRLSAGIISLYPPGTTLICPGEVIGKELVEFIKCASEAGLTVYGIDEKGRLPVMT